MDENSFNDLKFVKVEVYKLRVLSFKYSLFLLLKVL